MAAGSEGTLISQGAEARLFAAAFCGRSAVVKERFTKAYRNPALDRALTPKRTIQEARCLVRCSQLGIDAPTLYALDVKAFRITMEFIDGVTARQALLDLEATMGAGGDAAAAASATAEGYCRAMADIVARLHTAGIVHGDLTTSNFMVRNGKPLVIDFGISYMSMLVEDMAVDLYVLERAFLSTHPASEVLFTALLDQYATHGKKAREILRRLEDVRARGRKKIMIG